MKKLTLTMGLLLVTIISIAQKPEIFSPSGIAIGGYDVVSFFTDTKPVKGIEAYSTVWKESTWLFSSQQHLDSFKRSPEKYEPAYGGYCAYGTSRGYKAPAQADTWTILNDKLYFNYNLKVKEIWEKNRAAYIDSANSKWPVVKKS